MPCENQYWFQGFYDSADINYTILELHPLKNYFAIGGNKPLEQVAIVTISYTGTLFFSFDSKRECSWYRDQAKHGDQSE